MACTVTLKLLQGGDFPMDGAIYHPTRNSFFSVRGGYVYEFSTSLSQLQSVRFAASIYGRSSIAYDSVNDRIWIGVNGDHAAGYLGDTGGFPGNPAKSTVGLYRIIPSTLVTEQFLDPTTLFSVFNFGGTAGIYDVLVANAKLFASCWSSKGTGGFGDPTGMILAINLPAYTAAWSQSGSGPSSQLAHDTVHVPNRIWQGQDDDNFNQFQMNFWNDTNGGGGSSITSQPPNGAHQAVCFSSVGGGAIYQVSMPNTALVKINPTTAAIISNPAMAGASLGGMTSRIRFNSNDNLIYIPCPAANQMIAYDPSVDAVSKIYTTGMDSPCDVVFAPGGINVAIQSSSNGLKLLTT